MADRTPADSTHPRPLALVPLLDQDRIATLDAIPLTSFVGRETEIDAVVALLLRPDVRLVTLVGAGGIGKSRLALRVAETARDIAGEASAWVSLAPVRDPELALPTIAQALAVPHAAGDSLLGRVQATLAERRLLLVLDNLEHLLDAVAPLVVDLLAACPGLTVLATSRVRLNISGEQVVPLPPLDVETARALFAQRAQATDPAFAITSADAAVIDAICDRLDRLPLAIELAAARIGVLPSPALLARLDHRLDLLTGGPRDAPDRQRDMRAAIAWSHDLLTESERVLFRRLGVFVGGFSLDATQAVASEEQDAFTGVSALVAASLVIPTTGTGDEPRFTMLETIREFAEERLTASGEEETVRHSHAAWCLELAERAAAQWSTPNGRRSASRFTAEHANLRAALAWLTERADLASSLRLISAMSWFWAYDFHWEEGLRWLEQAEVWSAGARTRQRVAILNEAAKVPLFLLPADQVDWPHLTARSTEALEIAQEIGDVEGEFGALGGLANIARARQDWERAESFYEAGLDLLRQHAETIPNAADRVARVQDFLASVLIPQGAYARATELAEDALAHHRNLGFAYGTGESLLILAAIAYDLGDLTRAVPLAQEGLALVRDDPELWLTTVLLDRLAMVSGDTGQAEPAALLGGAVERLHERLGSVPNVREQPDRDRAREAARAQLGDAAFAATWATGRTLAIADAVAVADGITVPAGAVGMPHHHRTAAPAAADRHGLTRREREVLQLVAAGHSNREIAAILSISVPTVKRHVSTILAKLDLPSRSAATAYAHIHTLT